MNSTKINDKIIVNENPKIIVSQKVKNFPALIVESAVELRGKVKVVWLVIHV